MINAANFYSEEAYNEAIEEMRGDGYHHEAQRVVAHSRSQAQIINDRPRINELTAQGKFVVFSECEVCCPHTDATIGFHVGIVSVHDTREEAEAQMVGYENWEGRGIAEPRKPEPVSTFTFNVGLSDEVPF